MSTELPQNKTIIDVYADFMRYLFDSARELFKASGLKLQKREPLVPLRRSTTIVMRLPQEIYDLIIDHFHKDKPTLRRCALVSRAWVDRSQAHLFYFVLLRGNSLRLWVDKFSPSDGRIHSFVKNLMVFPPSNSFGYFKEHALAFKRLEALTITGERIPRGFQLFPCTN